MNKLENFEVVGKRGFYRPAGKVGFEQAVEMVGEAMRLARSLELPSLLVNTNALAGLAPPSIFARHALAVKWAESAGAHLHVALVARPELIDPQKIGVLMACPATCSSTKPRRWPGWIRGTTTRPEIADTSTSLGGASDSLPAK